LGTVINEGENKKIQQIIVERCLYFVDCQECMFMNEAYQRPCKGKKPLCSVRLVTKR
jgi:hypothetical protein